MLKCLSRVILFQKTGQSLIPRRFMSDERFVIRLRGLPWEATQDGVVDFLSTSTIKNGPDGVLFTKTRDGRKAGDAYVELVTMEDMKEAMKMNNKHMGSRYIEVFKAEGSAFDRMINNPDSYPVAGSKKSLEQANFVPSDNMIRLRGLPYEAGDEEVRLFFEGLEIPSDGILFCDNLRGRRKGQAYVSFNSAEDVDKAMQNNNKHMGSRYIEIFPSSKMNYQGDL
jgi:heterogeneous nuclear ribonucleoprotein F/H